MLVKNETTPTVPSNSGSGSSSDPVPPTYEEALREPAVRLKSQINNYEALDRLDESSNHDQEAQKVADAMREVGDRHPDPQVKKAWHEKSKKFRAATRKARREILDGVGNGPLHILVALPCTVVGLSLCVVSSALHIVGSVLGGVGGALSGGSRDERRASGSERRSGSHLLFDDHSGLRR